MKQVFALDNKALNTQIKERILNFSTQGTVLSDGDRNLIKTFNIDNLTINIKAFKIPNLINQIAYRFFRKSKAQRSFEYAIKLTALDIGTPDPLAYFENKSPFLFKKSYYVSEHLPYDLTFRELTTDLSYPEHEKIIRAFTRFCFNLHKKHINFLDHSPGNTLIQLNNGDYKFYLVDLNRMRFETMDFNSRMKNLSKLTIHESIVKTMSDEYAKCSGENPDDIFNKLWRETQDFQFRFHRKRRLKQKLKFWK